VLCAVADVAEAAVTGIADEKLGEAIHAFVVLRAGSNCTVQDIHRHCTISLEVFMVPREIQIVDSLPKTPNGKIDRRALKTLYVEQKAVGIAHV
jgi:long-chain acyl-CoA synthetase